MIETTLGRVAAVSGGVPHGDPGLVLRGPAYLDSRSPEPGGLFVALAGERSDGHLHAASAHAVLGSRPTARPTVVVPDPVVALGRLARFVHDAVRPLTVAVTGSSGKTGTKDLLAHLLPDAVATEGNRNNELGVPLTVLRATAATRRLVLETGSRGVGQLAYLADVAPPDVAVVLGVGSAHLAGFGSRELVAAGKGELVEALPASGTAVLNADDPLVAAMARRTVARVVTFGTAGDVSWREVSLDGASRPSFVLVTGGRGQHGRRVRLRAAGAHQVPNAAAAVAAALAAGADPDEVLARLATFEPVAAGRLRSLRRADGLLVVDDAYNANPESVRAALETLAALGASRPGRTVAVLGGMRELGPASAAAHAAIGEAARELGIDVVLAVGAPEISAADAHVPDRAAALAWLRATLTPDDTVLVKASRAAALDLLAARLSA